MSYPLDSDVQEDVRTFPMYQRLRKINPYAYYSLNTQKIAKQLQIATLDDLHNCAWLSDIAAMRHETQYSRVFHT